MIKEYKTLAECATPKEHYPDVTTDWRSVKKWIIENDQEDEAIRIISELVDSKNRKTSAILGRHEWAKTCTDEVHYMKQEHYSPRQATLLSAMQLFYIIDGNWDGMTKDFIKEIKEELPKMKPPELFYVPCYNWMKKNGYVFGNVIVCPECGSSNIIKEVYKDVATQTTKMHIGCKDCNNNFCIEMGDDPRGYGI